jgi:uncharacterized protein (PEP-CTERM system associated)
MGKPRRKGLAVAVGLAALSLAQPSRADWKFTPNLSLRETWTDNVMLAEDGKEQSQFITELTPGFVLLNQGPRIDFRASYNKHLYKYADESLRGPNGQAANSGQQTLQADLKAKLITDTLFLDSNATISEQGVSAFGPTVAGTPANPYAPGVSSEIKTWRVSPYLLHRFGTQANAELRYSHDKVTSDRSDFGTSTSDQMTLNLASGNAYRLIGWNLYYTRQNLDDSIAQSSSSQNLMGTLNYLYSPQLTLTVTGGYDKYDYQSLGGVTKGKNWSVGGSWRPSGRTSLQLNVGKRYFGDSYFLAAMHRTRTSIWTLNYSDAVTTTRSQFQLPSAVNTFSLLDQLFQAQIPDAAARRQAVEAYIIAAGLPPSLANSINYLSNRYMLQKQLQASAAFNSARGTLVLALVNSRRNGLSLTDVDAGLLGGSSNTLNDNTRQSSATATLNWRLSPRTSVNLTGSVNRSESLSQDRTDNNRSVRLSMTRQFARQVNGSVELRRVKGVTAVAGRDYTENAVSASVSKQF